MNYFYKPEKLKIDPVTGEKLIGKKVYRGVVYSSVLHSATEEDEIPIAQSYNELMDEEKPIAEEMIWTEVEVLGPEGPEKRMFSIKEWKTSGKPSHGHWFPRHVWLGVDPGFDSEKAKVFAEGN